MHGVEACDLLLRGLGEGIIDGRGVDPARHSSLFGNDACVEQGAPTRECRVGQIGMPGDRADRLLAGRIVGLVFGERRLREDDHLGLLGQPDLVVCQNSAEPKNV